ncbi:MAG: hypothetical protein B6U87_01025 [Candidatus Aenigmarchaeota archaeon ex4484_52]|nr:MAG: hypothetical protein B6U87_01025 [Candidatus Aenigmarchaeota archaeon ex4484_52]
MQSFVELIELDPNIGFCGNKNTREKISTEIKKQFLQKQKKPILIFGQSGLGKTYFVKLLAKQLDCQLICINGFEFRTRDAILNAKEITKQQSLFSNKKIIFFDNAEAIPARFSAKTKSDLEKERLEKKHGKKKKRKTKEIKLKNPQKELDEIIHHSKYPIIFATDEPSAKFIKNIKKKSIKFEFKKITTFEIYDFLERFCKIKNIEYEQKALNYIARICDSDIRCALIELNVAYFSYNKISYDLISKDNYRDTTSQINNCLKIIFKTKSIDASLDILSKNNDDKDLLMQYLRENIPYQYTKKQDIKNAYRMLSLADIFYKRIKANYWRYLIYVDVFLSAGICNAKNRRYENTPNSFRFPSKIAMYARMKFKTNL